MHDGVDAFLADLAADSAARRTETSAREAVEALIAPFALKRLAIGSGQGPSLTSSGHVDGSGGGAAELVESVECDGYRRDRYRLSVLDGLTFGTYVLVPDTDRATGATVLAVHGHGYGSREIVGLNADGSPDTVRTNINHHFGEAIAQRGALVVAPDVIGFGERISEGDRAYDATSSNSCYRLATNLLMNGLPLTGLRVTELLGIVEWLLTLDGVDADRVGIAGFSGGALWSTLTSVLEPRIAATLLIGFPNTFADSTLGVRHCLCNYLPGLLEQAEEADLISLIVPRPLFLESGATDPIFPAAGFEQCVEFVRSRYAELRASDLLQNDLHPGGHEVSGRNSFDWLVAALT